MGLAHRTPGTPGRQFPGCLPGSRGLDELDTQRLQEDSEAGPLPVLTLLLDPQWFQKGGLGAGGISASRGLGERQTAPGGLQAEALPVRGSWGGLLGSPSCPLSCLT